MGDFADGNYNRMPKLHHKQQDVVETGLELLKKHCITLWCGLIIKCEFVEERKFKTSHSNLTLRAWEIYTIVNPTLH